MLDSLLRVVTNDAYEAGDDEDQASYAVVIETGELVSLDDIVKKQRMVEEAFEIQIMQLASYEKKKVQQFRAEDVALERELSEKKAALALQIRQAEKELLTLENNPKKPQ